jgi:cation diffusion facilitator CzcD-associated flavoprotein CzcO
MQRSVSSPQPADASSRSPDPLPVVVVGAGPAGLAVAGELARRGLRARLLEAGETVGWAWRRHYPFLRLHTTRRDSSLPACPLPPGPPRYPGRDEYAEYLADYARRIDADVRLSCPVLGVRRRGGAWEVEVRGGTLRARNVVVAAGFNRLPKRPRLPGEETFGGPVLHSAEWADLAPRLGGLAGRRVLVAGLGNTGADLVEELRRAGAEVALAVAGPLHLVPRRLLGVDWRAWYRAAPEAAFLAARLPGLGRLAPRLAAAFWSAVQRLCFGRLERRGLRLQRGGEILEHWRARRAPLTSGPFLSRIRRGEVPVLPAVVGLHPGEAEVADGGRHACDALVLATGFRPALEELLEAEALPPAGEWPPDGQPGPLSGLWFCGYLPELIRIRRCARRIARHIAADLAADRE